MLAPTLVLLAAMSSPLATDDAVKPVSRPATTHAPERDACFDPQFARGWNYVDDNTVLIDGGRRKYRVSLGFSSFELRMAIDLGFKGDAVTGRICGHVGERLLVRGESLPIRRVELIDDATYQAASGRKHKAKRAPKTTEPGR